LNHYTQDFYKFKHVCKNLTFICAHDKIQLIEQKHNAKTCNMFEKSNFRYTKGTISFFYLICGRKFVKLTV